MHQRSLTPLDRLLAGANNALRTVSAPAGRPARENPASGMEDAALDDSQRAHSAGLMRVNHAGEVAAQGLYQGHAAVARDKSIEQQMQRAANEEFDHLAWCEERLTELEKDGRSRAILEKMHAEEAEHGENAIDAGAAELPPPVKRLMRLTAKVMTRTAYWL